MQIFAEYLSPHSAQHQCSVTKLAPNHFNTMIKAAQGNSAHTLGTLREHTEITPRSLRDHSENPQKALREQSEVTQRSLCDHSENTQRALR